MVVVVSSIHARCCCVIAVGWVVVSCPGRCGITGTHAWRGSFLEKRFVMFLFFFLFFFFFFFGLLSSL